MAIFLNRDCSDRPLFQVNAESDRHTPSTTQKAITTQERMAEEQAEAIATQECQQKEKLEAYLRSIGIDPDKI